MRPDGCSSPVSIGPTPCWSIMYRCSNVGCRRSWSSIYRLMYSLVAPKLWHIWGMVSHLSFWLVL